MFGKSVPLKTLGSTQGVEEMRRLCAKILTGAEKRHSTVIMVSSCDRGEGTTTVATNLARTFVQEAGDQVLLIDANLRHPALHTLFGFEIAPGLSDVIRNGTQTKDAIQESKADSLRILGAGTQIAYPGLVFNSPAMDTCLEQLRKKFRVIVLDAPPIVPFSDSLYLAKKSDFVLLVIEAEHTRWEVAQEAIQKLDYVGVQVYGTILNKKRFYIPSFLYKAL